MKWSYILIFFIFNFILDLILGIISEEPFFVAFTIIIDFYFILYSSIMYILFDKLKLLYKWNSKNILFFILQIPCYIYLFKCLVKLFFMFYNILYNILNVTFSPLLTIYKI